MSSTRSRDARAKAEADTGLEAAEWLLRLNDAELDPAEPFENLHARSDAFFDWIGRSPDHLRIFLETVEVHRRLPQIDQQRLIELEGLLARRFADVIPLRGE